MDKQDTEPDDTRVVDDAEDEDEDDIPEEDHEVDVNGDDLCPG